MASVQEIVAQQAEDDGLWFVAQTASEAYLQHELRRLHAAVESEWLPIESAPKDGTHILAWWPHLNEVVIAWRRQYAYGGYKAGSWTFCRTLGAPKSTPVVPPTHWMPLPPPPEASE